MVVAPGLFIHPKRRVRSSGLVLPPWDISSLFLYSHVLRITDNNLTKYAFIISYRTIIKMTSLLAIPLKLFRKSYK